MRPGCTHSSTAGSRQPPQASQPWRLQLRSRGEIGLDDQSGMTYPHRGRLQGWKKPEPPSTCWAAAEKAVSALRTRTGSYRRGTLPRRWSGPTAHMSGPEARVAGVEVADGYDWRVTGSDLLSRAAAAPLRPIARVSRRRARGRSRTDPIAIFNSPIPSLLPATPASRDSLCSWALTPSKP